MNNLYDWYGLNLATFLLINGKHWEPLDNLMLLVTALGHPKLYPFYLCFALWWAVGKRSSVSIRNVLVFSIAYVLVSLLIVPALKHGLDLPRPENVLGRGAAVILGNPDPAHSFPSGHAAFAVVLAASLGAGANKKTQSSLAVFALLVCFSRIYVGAHFPADVLAAALLAIVVVTIVRALVPGRSYP